MALVNDGSENYACRDCVCDLGRFGILGQPLLQTLCLGGTLWTGRIGIGIALVGTLSVALISSSECEFGSTQ